MNNPFEVGGRYRNRNGAYEVLSLEADQMIILYENGRVQTVSILLQARIWANIQADETPYQPSTYRPSDDDGLDTYPIVELLQNVLSTFSQPYPSDITDQVCLAIEGNPEWLERYHHLVEHFSSRGKDGKGTVNTSIGFYTKQLTGMIKIKEANPSKSSLMQTYSTLGYKE